MTEQWSCDKINNPLNIYLSEQTTAVYKRRRPMPCDVFSTSAPMPKTHNPVPKTHWCFLSIVSDNAKNAYPYAEKMGQHSSSHSSEQFSKSDTSADVLHLDCPVWLALFPRTEVMKTSIP